MAYYKSFRSNLYVKNKKKYNFAYAYCIYIYILYNYHNNLFKVNKFN